jgi:hypothetical protein
VAQRARAALTALYLLFRRPAAQPHRTALHCTRQSIVGCHSRLAQSVHCPSVTRPALRQLDWSPGGSPHMLSSGSGPAFDQPLRGSTRPLPVHCTLDDGW